MLVLEGNTAFQCKSIESYSNVRGYIIFAFGQILKFLLNISKIICLHCVAVRSSVRLAVQI